MKPERTVTVWVFGLNGVEKSRFISRAFDAKEGEKSVGFRNSFVKVSCVEVAEDWGQNGIDEETTRSLSVSKMFIFVVGPSGGVSGAISLFSRQSRGFLRVKANTPFVVLWPGDKRPGAENIDKEFKDISAQMGTFASLTHLTMPGGRLGEKLRSLNSG